MQMLHGIEQQQTIAQLQARGQNVDQKGHAADDPAPTAIGIEILHGKMYNITV